MRHYEGNVPAHTITWKQSATVYNECMRRAEDILASSIFASVVDENDMFTLTEALVENYEVTEND